MSSAPFVANLRSRKSVIRLAPKDAEAITIRVEMPEVWDVVRMEVLPTDQVLEVKTRALQALYTGESENVDAFVVKLRGWEILDEMTSLADAGVIDGSILLLTHRRRRPVR
jgi:hypothetical protein